MKRKCKLHVTPGRLFFAVTLTALFAFVPAACNNDPSGNMAANGVFKTKYDLDGYVNLVNDNGEHDNFFKPGETITAEVVEINAKEPYSYKWQWSYKEESRGFTDIAGEHGARYKAGNNAKGKYVRAVVTRAGYNGCIESGPVKIREGTPVVTGVTIQGKGPDGKITMSKGTGFMLETATEGKFLEWTDKEVIWTVTGGANNDTIITDGYLTVPVDESASSLRVSAVSVLNPAKSDNVTVTLTEFAGKIISITGLTGQSGFVIVKLMNTLDITGYDFTCCGGGNIDEYGNLTVPLEFYDENKNENAPWKGEGKFYILIEGLNCNLDSFLYTNGADITIFLDNIPQYDIQGGPLSPSVTTIAFGLFKPIPLGFGGRRIAVSGLSEFKGSIVKVGFYSASEWNPVASGHAVISEDTAMITMAYVDWMGQEQLFGWFADGRDYFVKLFIIDRNVNTEYVYTGGDTLEKLDINTWDDFWNKAPALPGTVSSLSFDGFVKGGEYL